MACVLDPERVFIVCGGMLNPWIWWTKLRNAVVVVVAAIVALVIVGLVVRIVVVAVVIITVVVLVVLVVVLLVVVAAEICHFNFPLIADYFCCNLFEKHTTEY